MNRRSFIASMLAVFAAPAPYALPPRRAATQTTSNLKLQKSVGTTARKYVFTSVSDDGRVRVPFVSIEWPTFELPTSRRCRCALVPLREAINLEPGE